jgi:predicted nucleic acid-binding protein
MTERVLVADSSPLIGLARIGQLELLRKLATRVLMPPAVRDEITRHSPEAPGASIIQQATWIEVEAPDHLQVEPLAIPVDRGEAEAIALAQRHPDSTLLLDDARARRVAERLGIRRIGTVGLLRRAKMAGLIHMVKPHLEALMANGIYKPSSPWRHPY